ncbi:hypothetical protein RvVAR0630_12430 [Agrobacterium vitis]|uniref:hypothetical protein n=1 Tax=Agrobacterium vitis TaxID=373 RepID=UPI0015D83889|nr:hypothetical protein [Agrobacterium vitis]BCH58619.1 hypothetical protein RvVAR0630_12430 [Agrobacterium vitis]
MAIHPDVRADFDRLKNQIKAVKNLPETASGDATSMLYEYLCVAITGRLEQNLKTILITYSDQQSKKTMSGAVSKLCQSFQNPDRGKIIELVSYFDKDFSKHLETEWESEGSVGHTISDMVGIRKKIAHQTTNARTATRTKVENFYSTYVAAVTAISNHFLKH